MTNILRCSLSGFPVTPLDSVPFRAGVVISGFLVDLWVSFAKTPACPVTGAWWNDDDVAQIVATTPKGAHATMATLNAFEWPSAEDKPPTAWTPEDLVVMRLHFWTHCINELLKETLNDNLCMRELNYLTRLTLYGALRECPTQTMTDLVTAYEALRFVDDDDNRHEAFYVEATHLRSTIREIMHYLLTGTRENVLQRIETDALVPNELPNLFVNEIHTFLQAAWTQDIFGLMELVA